MHTVISAFDNRSNAQSAMDRLTQSGFAQQDMHLEHRDGVTGGGDAGMSRGQWEGQEREVAVDRGALRSYGAFFASILGADHPHGETFANHVERGNYVLMLDAPSHTYLAYRPGVTLTAAVWREGRLAAARPQVLAG